MIDNMTQYHFLVYLVKTSCPISPLIKWRWKGGITAFPLKLWHPQWSKPFILYHQASIMLAEKFDSSKCWNFALSVMVLISLLRFPRFLHNMFNIYSFNFHTVWLFFTFSFNLSRSVFYDHVGFFSSSFFFQLMKIALLDNGSFLNINVRLCFVVFFFFL